MTERTDYYITTRRVELPGRQHSMTLGLVHANCATLTLHYPTPLGNMTTESAYLTRAELIELANAALDLVGRMPTTPTETQEH